RKRGVQVVDSVFDESRECRGNYFVDSFSSRHRCWHHRAVFGLCPGPCNRNRRAIARTRQLDETWQKKTFLNFKPPLNTAEVAAFRGGLELTGSGFELLRWLALHSLGQNQPSARNQLRSFISTRQPSAHDSHQRTTAAG